MSIIIGYSLFEHSFWKWNYISLNQKPETVLIEITSNNATRKMWRSQVCSKFATLYLEKKLQHGFNEFLKEDIQK